jgi:hypothetical protein
VYDPDRVSGRSVEDFVAIVNKERDANTRPLNDGSSAQWQLSDTRDNFLYARCNGFCES